jgi:gas vesicle protein
VGGHLQKGEKKMDQKQIFKQMMEFNKGAFNNAFNAMVMIQDQTETLANTMLNQATWVPEEGKKAIKEWVDTFKKGREEYKKAVDEAIKKVEEFF